VCNDGTPAAYYFAPGAARVRGGASVAPLYRRTEPSVSLSVSVHSRALLHAGSDPTLWVVYLEGGYWCALPSLAVAHARPR
jgi:hypothetical protein